MWKGKQRARDDDFDYGSGGEDGIVLPLEYTGTGSFDASYTLPIKVGSQAQNVSVQIDTGSSDLWIASTSCSSSECSKPGNSKLYDPDGSETSVNSNIPFNINYIRGAVSGPIVWDEIEIGGYTILQQAFCSAETVVAEPLSPSFSGILGLALASNSIIGSLIPATQSDIADGAVWPNNLFGITPRTATPRQRFISLTLSRPGSSKIPSLLGIGRHPPQGSVRADTLLKSPSDSGSRKRDPDDYNALESTTAIKYSNPMMSGVGQHFWKSSVADISVWVDGERREVDVGRGMIGAGPGALGGRPSAVIDSGVPLILTTKAVADGIYGAVGVGPGSDGQYYIPCRTPINISITLDSRDPLPLHPLDITAETSSTQTCLGTIQAADAELAAAGAGDMILGVPFLRNVYFVMGWSVPREDGSFPDLRPEDEADISSTFGTVPRLGLQSLLDADVAMEEFYRVRIEGKNMDDPDSSGESSSSDTSDSSSKSGMSVGIAVLVGLMSFVGLCFILFGLRWWIVRRRLRKSPPFDADTRTMEDQLPTTPATPRARKGFGLLSALPILNKRRAREASLGDYQLTPKGEPTEDELRQARFERYKTQERMVSEYTISSAKTRVGDGDGDAWGKSTGGGKDPDSWDPETGLDWSGRANEAVEDEEEDVGVGVRREAYGLDDIITQKSATDREQEEEEKPMVPIRDSSPLPPPGLGPASDEFGVLTGGGLAGIGTVGRSSRAGESLRIGSIYSATETLRMSTYDGGRRTPGAGAVTSMHGSEERSSMHEGTHSPSPTVSRFARERPTRAPSGPRLSRTSTSSHHS